MEPTFWHEAWENGRIGFHRGVVEPSLARHWPTLSLPPGSRVLVPLCGKSADLAWLAAQGHEVTGVELSPRACEDFFREHDLTPTRAVHGPFTAWSAGRITVMQGDVLELDEPPFDALYDRAASVALPPDLRTRYAARVLDNLAPDGQGLLITFEYPPEEREGPPFSIGAAEVERLFGASMRTSLLQTFDPRAQDDSPTAAFTTSQFLEHVWHLHR